MARRKPRRRGPQEPEEILGAAQQTLEYIRPYLKWLISAGVILILGFLGWSGYAYLQHSREANAQAALELGDYGYVIETGQVVLEDRARALLENPRVKEAYLG